MLQRYFAELGFNDSETQLYVALAEYGRSSAHNLSKRTGISRTTVYSILSNLVSKGVVYEEKKRGATVFVANSPRSFMRIVDRARARLREMDAAAIQIEREVTPFFHKKDPSLPKLKYFEGQDNVTQMLYDNAGIWQQSALPIDNTYWGYQDHGFAEQYTEWLRWSWRTGTPEMKVRLFSKVNTQIEQKLRGAYKLREIQALPGDLELKSSLWAVGDYVVIIVTRSKPHYAFQFFNPLLADGLRTLCKTLWKSSNGSQVDGAE